MPPAGLKGELRMRKRALSALAAAVLALVLCQGVMAASPGEVSVSSAQARPGESVTLTVSIRDNPGIAAGIWYIYYDTAVFSADPSKDVAAAGAFARAGSVVGNTIARVRANGRYDGEAGKDGLLVLWDSNTAENVDSSGDMLTVTLRVRPGAAAGSYTVSVTLTDEAGNAGAATFSGSLQLDGCGYPVSPLMSSSFFSRLRARTFSRIFT